MNLDDVVARTAFIGGGLVLAAAVIIPDQYVKHRVAEVSSFVMLGGAAYCIDLAVVGIKPITSLLYRIRGYDNRAT